jgi:hypothetical protein
MGVIPNSTVCNATIETEPRPFWQRIAQAIDRFMAQPVSEPFLRRYSVDPEKTSSGAIG